MITFGSLFAGIGGFDLGFERAGLKCLWQVEKDKYCLKVLEKHWPNVQRFDDILTLKNPPYVDVICGGFPCQDISNAGKRKGIKGERSGLWSEMLRIIRMVRPKYIVVENVAALINRGLSTVLGDLAESGYDAEWQVLSAAAFGAPHLRERVFIVAYPLSTGARLEEYNDNRQKWELSDASESKILRQENRKGSSERLESSCENVSNTEYNGLYEQKRNETEQSSDEQKKRIFIGNGEISNAESKGLSQYGAFGNETKNSLFRNSLSNEICHTTIKGLPDWAGGEMEQPSPLTEFERPGGREVERIFCNVDDGVPYRLVGVKNRVDKLKALGNAVVPQVVEYIGRLIIDYENKNSCAKKD